MSLHIYSKPQVSYPVAKIPLWSVTLKPVDWDVLNKTWNHGSGGEHPDTVAYTIGGGIIYIYSIYYYCFFYFYFLFFLLLCYYYFIIISSSSSIIIMSCFIISILLIILTIYI